MESEFKPSSERIDRKVILFVSVFFIVIVSAVVVYVNFKKEPPPKLDLYKVQKQELEITMTEMGDVKALHNTEVRLGFGMDQGGRGGGDRGGQQGQQGGQQGQQGGGNASQDLARLVNQMLSGSSGTSGGGGGRGGGGGGGVQATVQVFSSSPGMTTSTQPQVLYLIPEGTRAQAGDTLIRLDTSSLIDQRADIVENLKTAKQAVEDEINSQELSKDDDKESIQNMSYTLEKQRLQVALNQYSSESVKQQGQLSYTKSILDSVSLMAQLANKTISNRYRLQGLKDNVTRIQDQIKSLDTQIQAYTVIAPYPALVIYSAVQTTGEKIRQGDKINTSQALLTLPDLSTITAVMQINDIDRSKVWVGQEGEARLEAYPGVVFKGVITDFTLISRTSQESAVQMSFGGQMMRGGGRGGSSSSTTTTYSNVKVFEANLKLDGTDERLRPGMTATIDLVVEKLEGVVAVPLSAVFERETSAGVKTYVYVSKDGKNLQEKEVVLGKQNALVVEVKDGLKEGDTVIKQYPEGAGMKYGYNAEMQRREEATANLDKDFKTMEELGISFDYDKAREQRPVAQRGGGEYRSSAVRTPTYGEIKSLMEKSGIPDNPQNQEQTAQYMKETQHAGKDTVLKKLEQAIPKEGNIFNKVLNLFRKGAQDSTKIKK
jgi:hypothetical protein